MLRVVMLIISSFLGVAMAEVPAIIVNNVTLQGARTLFYERAKFISSNSLYWKDNNPQYIMMVTCINKHSAKCEMTYNDNDILLKDMASSSHSELVFTFIASKRGKQKLLQADHQYCLSVTNKDGSSNWRCVNRNRCNDPALLLSATVSLNVTTNKMSFNITADYEDHLIFYEYEEGDHLTLTCSILINPDNIFNQLTHYNFTFGNNPDTDKSIEINNFNKKVIHKQLSSSNDNTTLDCTLIERENNLPRRRITLLFRKTSTTVTDTSHKILIYEIVIINLLLFCAILLCLLILTSIILCKRKKRNVKNKSTGDSSLQQPPQQLVLSQQPSTGAPQSEVYYSATAIEKSECLYSNLCNTEAKKTPELNYALLDIPRSGNVLRKNDSVLYSEVCHTVA